VIFAAFLLTLIGTALLCVAMGRHWRQVFPDSRRSPAMVASLRLAGAAFLVAAAVFMSRAYGTGPGLTEFFGLLTVAILGIAVALPYRQRN